MRIAIVLGEFPSASEVFILQQITGLIDLGCEIHVFAGTPAHAVPAHALYEQYALRARTTYRAATRSEMRARVRDLIERRVRHVTRARSHLASVPREAWRALTVSARWLSGSARDELWATYGVDLLRTGRFDAVHAHFGDVARLCVKACQTPPPTPLFATFHGYDANVVPRIHGLDVYRPLFAAAAGVTVNSEFLENRLLGLGCPKRKLHVLPLGVDLSKFECRARTRGSAERLRLLSVARLVPVKGLDSAIRAVAHLRGRGWDLEYRIAGDGELRPELEASIRELGVGDCVHLLGALAHERVRELYQTSHVFVLPSVRAARGDEETQGVVVQEAQATGMPVVVSDIGGIREGIVEGVSGVSYAAGDWRALARAIEDLAQRPQTWAQAARAGRALVERKYDLAVLNRRLLGLYRGVCESS
jgi:colanic acid/amylovoran biosynthesis glycosyltransferase